ncbi:cytochrome ubiquinol oxidase subunit I [Lactiplantibacillus plantarum]|uniref:cytochrome ubiquinol oxidase subunit I n=1 Tax=Lactiplantibacillus plantarum TaxID=1590 RepID=UPI0040460305
MSKVTEEDIKKAAVDTVPNVAPLFWAFRVMVAVGMYLILFFGVQLRWLPSFGRGDVVGLGWWTTGFLTKSGLLALIMPAITLALFQMTLIRSLRT